LGATGGNGRNPTVSFRYRRCLNKESLRLIFFIWIFGSMGKRLEKSTLKNLKFCLDNGEYHREYPYSGFLGKFSYISVYHSMSIPRIKILSWRRNWQKRPFAVGYYLFSPSHNNGSMMMPCPRAT
jgi:hypothetical protein